MRQDDVPSMVESAIRLGTAGRLREAEDLYLKIAALQPDPTADILRASLLPPICSSAEDLLDSRTRLTEKLQRLVEDGVHVHVTSKYAIPGFFENYHGLDDRPLQELRAKLYVPPPDPPLRPRQGPKIRLGIVSKYFKEHTIGQLNVDLAQHLSRDEFELVFHAQPGNDPVTRLFQRHADQYVPLPPTLPQMRRVITDLRPDVLLYTDVGMEPTTYTLAMSRLAPVQCVTWGHPVTTGLATVDYFISSRELEAPEGDAFYGEKLVRLPDLAVYYHPPQPSAPAARREDFGLPAGANLYGCPQTLQKFHPDFDRVLASILRRDPRGILVLIEGAPAEWTQALVARFRRTMPDVAGRVLWLPRLNRDGFLHLNALCTVLLDPLHFGGGNTTYEALAVGTPVVTLPSRFLRGRISYALYRAMGVLDCVADSPEKYVEVAVRLGTTPDYRADVCRRIRAASPVLFENPAGLRQLEQFLRQAVAR